LLACPELDRLCTVSHSPVLPTHVLGGVLLHASLLLLTLPAPGPEMANSSWIAYMMCSTVALTMGQLQQAPFSRDQEFLAESRRFHTHHALRTSTWILHPLSVKSLCYQRWYWLSFCLHSFNKYLLSIYYASCTGLSDKNIEREHDRLTELEQTCLCSTPSFLYFPFISDLEW
jgi:hypothetical protein